MPRTVRWYHCLICDQAYTTFLEALLKCESIERPQRKFSLGDSIFFYGRPAHGRVIGFRGFARRTHEPLYVVATRLELDSEDVVSVGVRESMLRKCDHIHHSVA